MTMKAGNLEAKLIQSFDYLKSTKKDSMKHVGDIENVDVLFEDNIYFLKTKTDDIGFFQVLKHDNEAIIQNMYIDTPFRRQGLMSKFFFFLKRNEGYDKIRLGDVHSKDTIIAIQKIAHRFTTYWEKNGQTEPYSSETINDFYSPTKPTGWTIVLENDGDFSSWPKFNNSLDVRCDYSWLFNTELD